MKKRQRHIDYINLTHQMDCFTSLLDFKSHVRLEKSLKQALGNTILKKKMLIGQTFVTLKTGYSGFFTTSGASCNSTWLLIGAKSDSGRSPLPCGELRCAIVLD